MEKKITIKGWVARDKNGSLWFSSLKPQQFEEIGEWSGDGCEIGLSELDLIDFFEGKVRWENGYPREVEMTIKIIDD